MRPQAARSARPLWTARTAVLAQPADCAGNRARNGTRRLNVVESRCLLFYPEDAGQDALAFGLANGAGEGRPLTVFPFSPHLSWRLWSRWHQRVLQCGRRSFIFPAVPRRLRSQGLARQEEVPMLRHVCLAVALVAALAVTGCSHSCCGGKPVVSGAPPCCGGPAPCCGGAPGAVAAPVPAGPAPVQAFAAPVPGAPGCCNGR
jgi:hypothetical protein